MLHPIILVKNYGTLGLPAESDCDPIASFPPPPPPPLSSYDIVSVCCSSGSILTGAVTEGSEKALKRGLLRCWAVNSLKQGIFPVSLTGLWWAAPYYRLYIRRWRLQRAFFYGRDEGFFGCQGITCDDFFPVVGRLCPHKGDPDSHEQLTMHDIRDTKPEYISNMTVDYWKGAPDKPPFELMAISPHEVARIDHQPGACGGQDTLSPRHVKVADAMTIAASVVTNKETLDDPFRDLQILLGLAIRKHKKSYYSQDEEQTPLSKVSNLRATGWTQS